MTRDSSQEEIIYSDINKSYLVIAPPGYGKTFTMGRRIKYIIENKKISGKLIGLTFTNAAANEMFNRLDIDDNILEKKVYITTFHSFCYNILRNYGSKIELNQRFNIISPIEREDLLKKNLIDLGINQDSIDNVYKNDFSEWILEKRLKLNEGYKNQDFEEIFNKAYDDYENNLKNENKLDFNYLIIKVIELWKKYPVILNFYRKKYEYVLVDEFQDSNMIQYQIFKYLINGVEKPGTNSKKLNFMCFGDDFQSIFIFQGALSNELRIILDDFDYEIKELRVNHRTTSSLIKSINLYLRKGELSTLGINNKIDCYLFNNVEEEAIFILEKIKEFQKGGIALDDICIISRMYFRLNNIKELFENNDLEFIYLKDFRNDTIERKYLNFFNKFDEIILEQRKSGKISSIFMQICENSGYDFDNDIVLQTIYEYIKDYELRKDIKKYHLWEKIQLIKNDMLLELNWGEKIREKTKGKIYLSSVHQVKGLEFSKVIFVGLENFEFPHPRICIKKCINNEVINIQEEKNILYVGISRTKSNLILTSLKQILNREGKIKKRTLSCLLQDIEHFINIIDINNPLSSVTFDSKKCWNC